MEQINHGESLFLEGKVDDAKEYFLALLGNNPSNPDILNNIGTINYSQGENDTAEEFFLQAIENDTNHLDARMNLVNLFQSEKRWKEVINHLESLIKSETGDFNLYNQLGMAYIETGENEKATVALSKSLDLNPDQEAVKESLRLFNSLIAHPLQKIEKEEKESIYDKGNKCVSVIEYSTVRDSSVQQKLNLKTKLLRLRNKTHFKIYIVSFSDMEKDNERRLRWGDYWVKLELEKEFRAAGYTITNKDPDIIFHMFGAPICFIPESSYNIIWIHSHPNWITSEILKNYDQVYSLSPKFIQKISSWGINAEALIGATSKKSVNSQNKYDIVFVGNAKGLGGRRIINDLGRPNYNIKIWGEGWQNIIPSEWYGGLYYKNEDLPNLYASSTIVLNDHHEDMRQNGFLNPRILDIFASGSLAISDQLEGAEDIFGKCLPMYKDPKDLRSIIDHYLNNPEERYQVINAGKRIALSYTFEKMVQSIQKNIDKQIIDSWIYL